MQISQRALAARLVRPVSGAREIVTHCLACHENAALLLSIFEWCVDLVVPFVLKTWPGGVLTIATLLMSALVVMLVSLITW